MNFYNLLQQHVSSVPERIAFYDEDRSISYITLKSEVDRLANLMHELGCARGDRLALWMPNCIEWLVTFLASAKLGITVISVNTRFKAHEVGQLIQRGECKWLAVWPTFKGLPFAEILNKLDSSLINNIKGIIGVGDCTEIKSQFSQIQVKPFGSQPKYESILNDLGQESDGALVYTTSGTTSLPKLVLHRQAGLVEHGKVAGDAYGVTSESVVLLAAPLCGAFGFSTALTALAKGATLVSLPVFNSSKTVEQIRAYKVTHTFANNEMIDLLLREVAGEINPFPSLEYVGFASFAPSIDDLPERALKAGIPIAALYGSSELQALVAGQKLSSVWENRRMAGGTLSAPNAQVRAVDFVSGKTLTYGEVGYIEIKAPSIMSEYLGDKKSNKEAFTEDGFFRTGDLGYTISSDTFVYQGRGGDHLRLGGFLVNPREIEGFIERIPGVKAVQVVGSEFMGKLVPIAFVIPDGSLDLSEDSIISVCTKEMAKFKVPTRIKFIDEFPMVQSANSNKVQRHVLQEMAKDLLKKESLVN